jgi:predicted Ser/Thr protein kinase
MHDRNDVVLDNDEIEIDSDDTIGKQVSQKKRVKMDVVVDADDVWCIDFQKECAMRAQSNNEASPFDVLRLTGVKQQRAAERFKPH